MRLQKSETHKFGIVCKIYKFYFLSLGKLPGGALRSFPKHLKCYLYLVHLHLTKTSPTDMKFYLKYMIECIAQRLPSGCRDVYCVKPDNTCPAKCHMYCIYIDTVLVFLKQFHVLQFLYA